MKRWPNALGNGAGHAKLLETSEDVKLPPNCPPETQRVLPMMAEVRRLRPLVLAAQCNEDFVKRHRARLATKHPGMSAYCIDTKVWSLLVGTREHAILMESVQAVSRLNQPSPTSSTILNQVEIGALLFDGHMSELPPHVTEEEAVAAINARLAERRWDYEVAAKPNFGLERQPVASAVAGREALRDAVASYPAVRQAVAQAVACRSAMLAPAHSLEGIAGAADASASSMPPALIDTTPSEGVRKGPPETGDFNEKEFEQFVRSALGGCSKSQREAVQEIVQAMSEQQLRRWEGARKQMEQRHATVRGRAQEAKASLPGTAAAAR